MKDNSIEIEYKAKGMKNNIPCSIVRKTTSKDTFIIEYCNPYQGWKEMPELISCWWGSFDDGYGSPPDGEDISKKRAEDFIDKWEKNWNNNY